MDLEGKIFNKRQEENHIELGEKKNFKDSSTKYFQSNASGFLIEETSSESLIYFQNWRQIPVCQDWNS